MADDVIREIEDIGVAGYLNMLAEEARQRGEGEALQIRLVKVVRNGRKSTFFFKGPEAVIDNLSVQFPGSESFRFDSMVRTLKSLGYSRDGKPRGQRPPRENSRSFAGDLNGSRH